MARSTPTPGCATAACPQPGGSTHTDPPLTQRPSLWQVLLVINYLQTLRTPVLPRLDPLTLLVAPQKLVDRRPQKPVDAVERLSNRICSGCGKAFYVCDPACWSTHPSNARESLPRCALPALRAARALRAAYATHIHTHTR